jgi:hypothetical protein
MKTEKVVSMVSESMEHFLSLKSERTIF